MNILLTSAGRRTYLINYFKEALAGTGKVFASNSILTYCLEQADDYVLTPNIYDDGYITFLLDFCKKKNIQVIISLFDIDLPVLAKNKDVFKQAGIDFVNIEDVTFLNPIGKTNIPTRRSNEIPINLASSTSLSNFWLVLRCFL
jgi:hypothetical protein